MRIEFNAQKRTLQGTGASRRLRRGGRVPGILYGGEKASEAIEFDHNEIFHKLKQESFHASVLTMLLGEDKQMVLLRDVQMHPFKRQVLHLDFQRVDATHKITTRVPLHFINADQAPGVKLQGGIVSHVMNEIEVRCLPGDLPEFVEVDLKDVSTGQSVHLSALSLPAGVEAVTHRGEDPVVAAINVPRSAVAEEAASAAEQAAAAPAAAPAAPAPEKK